MKWWVLFYSCLALAGLSARDKLAFGGSTAEADFFGDYARKSSPSQDGAILYSGLGYSVAPRVGVGINHTGSLNLTLSGRYQVLQYTAPTGSTLSPQKEALFDFLAGLKYFGDSTRLHLQVGLVSNTYVQEASATALNLVQTQAPQGGLEFTWLALRGPSHDVGLGVRANYTLGSSASGLTIANGVGVGGEVFVDLGVGGLPAAFVLGTDISAGKVGAAYQIDSRVTFGLRVIFIDTTDRGPSRFITR